MAAPPSGFARHYSNAAASAWQKWEALNVLRIMSSLIKDKQVEILRVLIGCALHVLIKKN
jgi:hypothetical protein